MKSLALLAALTLTVDCDRNPPPFRGVDDRNEDRRPEHEKSGQTYDEWYRDNYPIIPSG